jgi:hypothetical protein
LANQAIAPSRSYAFVKVFIDDLKTEVGPKNSPEPKMAEIVQDMICKISRIIFRTDDWRYLSGNTEPVTEKNGSYDRHHITLDEETRIVGSRWHFELTQTCC